MKLTIREICIFGLLGGVMYASKAIMAMIPNVHLVGVFIIAITAVYRRKALYPLYVFVLLSGLFDGFGVWWLSYLYIWLPLWGATMVLPEKMNPKILAILYMCVCALHGFLYGVLYAPFQAMIFGLNLEGLISWMIAGIPFDIIHGTSNFFCGLMIMPIIHILKRIERK